MKKLKLPNSMEITVYQEKFIFVFENGIRLIEYVLVYGHSIYLNCDITRGMDCLGGMLDNLFSTGA